MNAKAPKKKIPVKTIYHHVIRAKIYSILTLNALEGLMNELNHTLDSEYLQSNFDIFDEGFRRYQGGIIFPTCYGDYLDRAVKSLGKELGTSVTTELSNTQAVKKVIMTIARSSNEQEKAELLEWLKENNDYILKSSRFDSLINSACLYFYKKSSNQVSEDCLNFIRRSANELLRNKASKDAIKKRLTSEEDDSHFDKVLRANDSLSAQDFDLGVDDDDSDDDDSDDDYIIKKKDPTGLNGKRMRDGQQDEDYEEKRLKHIAM